MSLKGWQSAIRQISTMINKKEQEDSSLPFDGKIGGVVSFQMTPFIKAEGWGSLVLSPSDSKQFIIEAISRLRIGLLNGSVYRYYLSKGDTEDEPEVFIQIYCDNEGVPVEALYCTQLTRMYPQTVEEQDLFTGNDANGLGSYEFTLLSDQLTELGILASDKTYYRALGSGEFVIPCYGKEVRIDDSKGNTGLEQEIYYMPYHRNLDGQNSIVEHLLITTEIVKTKDHIEEQEIHVDFMVGLPLELSRITIQ